MAASLKQIAEESGLSVPSVSRVLRGDPAFAESTRQRVFEIAKRLKYRPNMLVKSIQSGCTRTVGVMVPPLDEFLSEILMGVHRVLAGNDYVPILLWAEPKLPELEQIHRLVDRRVDGFILFPSEDAAPDNYLSEVWDRGLPLVTVDRRMKNTHADFAGTDDTIGAELAADHLFKLGHRSIGHVTACPNISTSQVRWRVFREFLDAAGNTTVVKAVADDFLLGYEPALKMLQAKDRPTAIFAANDMLAMSVIKAATKLGLSVPDDLSVMGYADLGLAKHADPGITTVRQNPRNIGKSAAQLLIDRLEGRVTQTEPISVLEKPELVERGSTAPPR